MKKSRMITVALLLAALAVVVLLHPLHERIGAFVDIGARVVDTHPVAGVLVFIVLSMISAMLAFFSTAAVVPIAVTAWGKAAALVLLWVGWWLGGALTYAIGRYLGRGVVMHFIDAAKLDRYERQFSKIAGFPQVLLLQMALPSEVPGYVFGVLRCSPAIYLTALAIAELPFAFGAVFLGESFVRGNLPLLIALGFAGIALGWLASKMLYRRIRA